MNRILPLSVLAILLASLLATTLRTHPTDPVTSPNPPANTRVNAAPVRTPGLEQDVDRDRAWVTAILARPLFSPDRRPARVGPARATAGAVVPRVAGIVIDGPRRSVIFAAPTEGAHPITLLEGNEVNGFRIRSIEDNQVTILGADGLHILRPTFDPRPLPPRSAVPTPTNGLPDLSGLSGLPGLPAAPPQAR